MSEPVVSGEMFDRFHSVMTDIQRHAINLEINEFHNKSLISLQKIIDFDMAWWGHTSIGPEGPVEHSSSLLNLGVGYIDDWRSISGQDITPTLTRVSLKKAICVDIKEPCVTDGLRWLASKYHFSNYICIEYFDDLTGLHAHISLYRREDCTPFEHLDQFLIEKFLPYLITLQSFNKLQFVSRLRSHENLQKNIGLAVCDKYGVLLSADESFLEILSKEWPQWIGPQLPEKVHLDNCSGKKMHITLSPLGGYSLIRINSRSDGGDLSAREFEVAIRFGAGQSYKEIASDLGIAPNTVRYHIRGVYKKLNINSKVKISEMHLSDG